MIITCASSKGGVGKSTTCACLAGAFAHLGETVHIVCDASMQKCLMPERYAAPIRSAIRVTDRDEQQDMDSYN